MTNVSVPAERMTELLWRLVELHREGKQDDREYVDTIVELADVANDLAVEDVDAPHARELIRAASELRDFYMNERTETNE